MRSLSGSILRAEREAIGVGQEAVARHMGVSVKTVQRLEAATAVKPASVIGYRGALALASTGPDNVVSRGTNAGLLQGQADIPRWAQERIEDAILDMARAGMTNEQAREIRKVLQHVLQADVVLRHVFRGRSIAAQQAHLEDIIESMRFLVERLAESDPNPVAGEINPITPGGAPVAPVTAAEDPTANTTTDVAKRRGKEK